MALNVTDLITNLLPVLHAPDRASLVFWTDAQLTRWFKDALIRHAQRFGVFVKRDAITVDLVEGVATYAAPPNLCDVMHISLNGVPLVASSTSRLELLDDAFQTTQGTPRRWYPDRIGANRIGVYPVPDAAVAGQTLEIVYHEFPCNLDEAHTNVDVEVPPAVGRLFELQVIGEARGAESDAAMPEVAASARQISGLLEQVVGVYYGEAQ